MSHEIHLLFFRSALGSNMYTYLKFGLPRVFPPNHNGSNRSGTPQHFTRNASTRPHVRFKSIINICHTYCTYLHIFHVMLLLLFYFLRGPKAGNRGPRDGSSGYDSSDNETTNQYKHNRKYRSDPDFRMQNIHPSYEGVGQIKYPQLPIIFTGSLSLFTFVKFPQIDASITTFGY